MAFPQTVLGPVCTVCKLLVAGQFSALNFERPAFPPANIVKIFDVARLQPESLGFCNTKLLEADQFYFWKSLLLHANLKLATRFVKKFLPVSTTSTHAVGADLAPLRFPILAVTTCVLVRLGLLGLLGRLGSLHLLHRLGSRR